ncbi:MAG: IS630 family transposase [Candidatus Nealsonbacteria bacterium]|nr:IS630 family transposase [Candidatus Nealsonbacteria bacterium]
MPTIGLTRAGGNRREKILVFLQRRTVVASNAIASAKLNGLPPYYNSLEWRMDDGLSFHSVGGVAMSALLTHQCKCTRCQRPSEHPDKLLHHQLNVLLAYLNGQQRRWVAAMASRFLGSGGIKLTSRITGLSPDTIRDGQHDLDTGLQGYWVDPGRSNHRARHPGGGRPRRLTADQANRLKELLSQGATAHGWVNDLWTLRRIRQLVQRELGERLCLTTLRRALKEQLGWTLQKPVQQLRDHDDEEVDRWKKEEFSRIKHEASCRHAHLVFIDESGFMLAPTCRRTYAPRGSGPVVKVTDPHAKISAIAAIVVSPKYGNARLVYQLSPDRANFNGSTVTKFLRFLCDRVQNRMTVIWDSIRIHYAEPVRNFLTGRNTLVLERFPPNTSGLNPADGIWSYIKYGRLPNYAPLDLPELRRTLTAEFRRLKKHPNFLFSFIRRTGLTLDD